MNLDAKIKSLNDWARDKFYRRGEQKITGKRGSELYIQDTWGPTRKGDWFLPQLLFNTSAHLAVGLLLLVFQLSGVLGVASIAAYREYTQPQGTWYKKTYDVICFCLPSLIVDALIILIILGAI